MKVGDLKTITYRCSSDRKQCRPEIRQRYSHEPPGSVRETKVFGFQAEYGCCKLWCFSQRWSYQNILDNVMFPTLWQHFEEGPFPFQPDLASVHKEKALKTLFERDWPVQSPLSTFVMNWNRD